ncbi:MAG: hypothetical protein ACYC6G_00125 [Desulfobaccales bacterium]
MHNNKKRIVILAALTVLLFAGQVTAQISVLGFNLGKDSYNKVKSKLPGGAQIKVDEGKPDTFLGGPWFSTDGIGYGIEGLKGVQFCFDKKQTLSRVGMFLEGHRLNDIKKILPSKYRILRSQYPNVFLLYRANRDYIYLYLPRDKDIVVEYMTDAVYRRGKLQERQTAENKKALEREEQKEFERDAAVERAKF